MDIQSLSPELVQPSKQAPSDAVPADQIDSTFRSSYIDLISAPLLSRILAFSNEFFASASNLTNAKPPIHRPGVFVPSGAWYDGWETRRHNPAPYDWVIIRLGVTSGVPRGVEIDTAFFSGNEAPEISVDGCFEPSSATASRGKDDEDGKEADVKVVAEVYAGWKELLGRRACGPSQRQAWQLPLDQWYEKGITHVRLRMYPDGGIARFRLYGTAIPLWPSNPAQEVELSAATMGGVATSCSDQHFGVRENLLLPGRGVDMGDGWETRRSREKGHVDWVVVRLGAKGTVRRVVIDTAHFRGNFPQRVKVDGMDVGPGQSGVVNAEDKRWVGILPEQALGPDAEHEFGMEVLLDGSVRQGAFTHVKMTIIPDGGVKRLRIFGTKA